MISLAVITQDEDHGVMKRAFTLVRSLDIYLVLDLTEKLVLVYFLIGFILAILPQLSGQVAIVDIAVLVSETMAVIFILLRRLTKDVSLRPFDWIAAMAGAFLPLLVEPSQSEPFLPLALSAGLLAAGIFLQISAKLTLRRSFGIAQANRGVKVGGPYGLVRHPMYAGYLMTHIAFLGTHPSLRNLVIYMSAFAAQCLRVVAEERILSADDTYKAFMQRTKYRLIPFVF
jgi:protein-S-isoprenylcysteine O-methyltransferase Ste14